MLLGIVILLIVLVVAYFHYAQGLFSATISAICSLIAALVSVSYHENVIGSLLKGAMANQAQAMVMCALFALTYVVLRVIADKTIPGNVRYPLMVDKIGSAVMGIFAGLFAAGVVALAAQSLPFAPSVAGYARFSVFDHQVRVPGTRNEMDTSTLDEVKDSMLDASHMALDPTKKSSLIIPADEMLLGVVGSLSSGALFNDHPLAAVHPDWPTELFGQRTGVQVGSKHVLLNLPSLQMVDLRGLFAMDSVREIDGEMKMVRETPLVPEKGDMLKVNADETLLVARIFFDSNAADEDSKVRVSCAAVRLVGWKESNGTKEYSNFHPIGTLEDASILLRNKPDDPLILTGGKAADFVFKLPRAVVYKDATPKAKDLEIKSGVFIEVKRMARVDLASMEVKGAPTPSKDVEVLRKNLEQLKNIPKRTESGQTQAAVDTVAGPIDVAAIKVSDQLFSAINPGSYNGDTNVAFRSGNATMRSKKFAKLTVNTTDTMALLGAGDFATKDLFVGDGKKMVQVSGKPPAGGKDPWAWAEALNQFELVDATGNKYKPNGAFAEVKQTGQSKMAGNYDADAEVPAVAKEEGRPMNVYIVFNVPSGTAITQLNFEGKAIKAQSVQVP